jgi:SpoVK/Ycf46/Vps4 family AAA+-type ATPase
MRPGRFDRNIYVGPPDCNGREEILRICMRSMRVEQGIDFSEIAQIVRQTPLAPFRYFIRCIFRPKDVLALSWSRFVKKQPYSQCGITWMHNLSVSFVWSMLLLKMLQIPQEAFLIAAKALKPRITPGAVRSFEDWRDRNSML